MSDKHRGFLICLPETVLTIDDIWPMGDAPENPTADDVVAVMRESAGYVGRVIAEWNLVDEIEVFDQQTATRAFF